MPGTYYSLVNEGTLNITGGTFNFGNLGRLVASIGTLNISGGDVNGNVTVEAGTFKVSGGQIKRLIVTTSEPGSTGIGIDAFIPTVTINGGKFKRIESMIHMNAEGFTYPKTLSELLADGYAFKYKGNWVDGTLYEVGDANGTDFVTVEKAPIVSYKSSADNATDYGTSSTFKIYDVVVNDGYAAGDVTYVWKDNGVTVSSTTAEWSQVLAEGEHEVTCTLTLDGYSVPHKFEKKTIVKPERIITLDASALSGYTVKNGYKYVYYGTYNGKAVKWRVLATAYKYDAADTTKTGMLLLSENALAATQFGTDDNIWHGSTALIWCNNMYGSSFGTGDGTKEQDFILRTSSTDGVNEYLFFLSKDEASKPEYFPNDSNRIATLNSGAAWWWLRSPYQYDGESAYIVYDDGSIDGAYVTSSHGARPAFNLNPAYVLFTFGKGAKPITFGTMQKNGYYEPASGEKYEYKLTMLDEKRNNFAVNTTKVKGDKGQRIAIDFSDATDGGSEAISAMIVDKTTGEVLYYGQGEKGNVVTDGGTMSGTVYFVLPTDIAYGEYVLKVFNEQLNGNGKTDFSSDFKTLTLKVAPKASFETEPTAITNLSYNGMPQALVTAGTSNEGVVKYAMDENAVYSESVPQQTFVHNNYKVWFYVEGDDDHADSDKEYVTASISAKDIAGATITLAGGLTYNGQAQTQGVTKVEIDGMTLADGEYDVADNVATNAGNYTLTVTGKGNFAGTQTEDFRIEKLPVEIEWSAENEYVYDSTVKSVTASVKNRKGTDDVNLVTDGTFSATDVGDYTAEIKGVENPNYTTDGVQNLTKNWKITTTASDIVLNVPTSVEYGDDLTITVNVAKKGNLMSLMAAEDEVAFYVGEGTNKKSLGTVRVNYTASDEGTATLTVKTTDKQLAIGANVISAEYGGSANLAGGSSANKTVTMTKKPISLTWNNDVGLVYDGTEKAVGATAGGTEDGDGTITVTVTGGTEKKAGKHTATATGLDGSNAQYYELPNDVQHEYTIARRAIDAEWTVPSNAVYNRSEYTVTAKVKNAVNGDSVKLTLKNNVKTDKGDYIAEVIAADDDNYTLTNGTNLTKEWSISAKDIAGATIALAGGLTYNGQAQTQGVTKVEIDGMTLADGEYDVADNVATNAGNYTLTVTGKGNFAGTQTKDWNILTASPTEKVETTARILKNIELTYATVTYGEMAGVDGKALEGTFEWVDDTKKLSKNSTEQMIFTPNDSNYKAIKFDVDVTTFESSGGSFVAARYTVKFDTNGGSKIANQTVTNNKKATRPAKPTKDGYIFDDWYADKDLTVRYDFAKPVTADITLYAKWDKDEVQVPTTAEWKNPFTDVKKGDWFYDNVKFAHQNGLMNGVEKTLFAPDESLTRAMLVTVLWRLEGQPSVDYAIPFTDIDENEYYVEALRWAASEKIVLGVSETEFAPDDDIIREQIAAIMFRYAKYKGYDVTIGEDTNILSYTDYDEISEYAIEAMQYAVGSGLIKGKTESTLNPLDNATRAEVAAIMQRFIEAN